MKLRLREGGIKFRFAVVMHLHTHDLRPRVHVHVFRVRWGGGIPLAEGRSQILMNISPLYLNFVHRYVSTLYTRPFTPTHQPI